MQQTISLLRSIVFNVDRNVDALILQIKELFLTFSIICWYINLNVQNRNQLHNAVKVASKITGEQQLYLPDIFRQKWTQKGNPRKISNETQISPIVSVLGEKASVSDLLVIIQHQFIDSEPNHIMRNIFYCPN